jgi:hypothetical protein
MKGPEPVDRDTDDSAPKPRTKAIRIDEQVKIAKRSNESLLRQILAFRRIIHDRGRQHDDFTIVAPHKLVTSIRRAVAGQGDKIGDVFLLHTTLSSAEAKALQTESARDLCGSPNRF